MSALALPVMHLAEGPAMYFGATIMTFALPYGAFIVAAVVLYFLFRAKHTGPRLKYLHWSPVTSVLTREPGPVPAPRVAAAGPETAAPETAAPETAAPETEAAEAEAAEGKDGE